MWTNRTNSKTAKSLSAQSSYGLASSLFSTGCTWSAEGALCEKSLTLTGKQSLHGAAVGYQTCVSASLIVPFNTHTLTRIHRVTPLADILRDFKTSQHNYLILLFNGEESAEFACTDCTQLAHKFHKKQINTIWQGRQSCSAYVLERKAISWTILLQHTFSANAPRLISFSLNLFLFIKIISSFFFKIFQNVKEVKQSSISYIFVIFCMQTQAKRRPVL